jgi:hypothetical protein
MHLLVKSCLLKTLVTKRNSHREGKDTWSIDDEDNNRCIQVIKGEIPFVGHPKAIFLRCLTVVTQERSS